MDKKKSCYFLMLFAASFLSLTVCSCKDDSSNDSGTTPRVELHLNVRSQTIPVGDSIELQVLPSVALSNVTYKWHVLNNHYQLKLHQNDAGDKLMLAGTFPTSNRDWVTIYPELQYKDPNGQKYEVIKADSAGISVAYNIALSHYQNQTSRQIKFDLPQALASKVSIDNYPKTLVNYDAATQTISLKNNPQQPLGNLAVSLPVSDTLTIHSVCPVQLIDVNFDADKVSHYASGVWNGDAIALDESQINMVCNVSTNKDSTCNMQYMRALKYWHLNIAHLNPGQTKKVELTFGPKFPDPKFEPIRKEIVISSPMQEPLPGGTDQHPLQTQAQVNSFADYLTAHHLGVYHGGFYVVQASPSSDPVRKLPAFPYYWHYISRDLQISNTSLANIQGIKPLELVSHSVSLTGNSLLSDMSGLSNVSFIGRDLNICDNPKLESINAFDHMAILAGHVNISNNAVCRSMGGLVHLSTLNSLKITDNPQLDLGDCDAFSSTGATNGLQQFILYNNGHVNSYKGFQKVVNTAGDSIVPTGDNFKVQKINSSTFYHDFNEFKADVLK